MLHLVGYLRRCTKMMHGHTNIKFSYPCQVYMPDRKIIMCMLYEMSVSTEINCVILKCVWIQIN